jgi:hypothetical protein
LAFTFQNYMYFLLVRIEQTDSDALYGEQSVVRSSAQAKS